MPIPDSISVTSSSSYWTRSSRRVVLFAPLFLLAATAVRAGEPAAVLTPSAGRAFVSNTAGALVVVGGGKMSPAVRDRFFELAGGNKARLVVVPTASQRADSGDSSPSCAFWRSLGIPSVELLHTRSRTQASEPDFVKQLKSATAVWLTGGDQSRLTSAYLGTPVVQELRRLLDRGGVIAGTSAGASVMSSVMITGGTTKADLDEGFGLTPGLVVDQHFTNRNRMGRLLGVLTRHPDMLGVGIDEETAVLIKGTTMSVLGEANVYVCMTATPSTPVNVQRLKHGDQLDLDTLSQTLFVRNRAPSDKTTLVNATKTPPETPTMGKGR